MISKECMFCGNPADTREHIIPQWIHRMFQLQHEQLRLVNESKVKYLHQVVPACKYCNGERYSQIENKVRNLTATDQELYIWGLKIYRGLNLKDTYLQEDQKDASKGMINTAEASIKGIEFSKFILANYGSQGFSIYPNPFGSVFVVHLPKEVEQGFALCSIGYPHNVITISVSRSKLLTVVLNDRGMLKKAVDQKKIPPHSFSYNLVQHLQQSEDPINANTYAKFLTFHYSKWKHRINLPKGIKQNSKCVRAIRIPNKIKVKKEDDPKIIKHIADHIFPDWIANMPKKNCNF